MTAGFGLERTLPLYLAIIYLRKQAKMVDDKRQAGTEIEITPEMITLGVELYWKWEESEDYRTDHFVERLYRELRLLERSSHRPSG